MKFGGSSLKKTLAGTAWCKDCQIHYYLLTDRLDHDLESYGVLVEYLGETAVCSGIAPRCRQIMELLELLQRGAVTPVTLGDVVEDWLLSDA